MSDKIRFNEEIGFLETWDRIRKQITDDQSDIQEFVSMLDKLTYYSELATENCKPKNCEIYNALCCVLREEVVNKKKHITETSKCIDEQIVVDSGFGVSHSESLPTKCNSILAIASHTDVNQKVTSHRSKYIKPRPQKLCLQNKTHNVTADKNVFNSKKNVRKQSKNASPYVVAAVMCFACLIAFVPHRFFPWFFMLTSFNSPPPL